MLLIFSLWLLYKQHFSCFVQIACQFARYDELMIMSLLNASWEGDAPSVVWVINLIEWATVCNKIWMEYWSKINVSNLRHLRALMMTWWLFNDGASLQIFDCGWFRFNPIVEEQVMELRWELHPIIIYYWSWLWVPAESFPVEDVAYH